ncbi:MAG TPA: 16S rRNA (guanine(527)-N(7))-methyltransferase RsmG [Spirochaetia bacterium]|nr:16S rRNA (guanine(527)-N(7))-methyltransferase RsmG [Spirochaetia bacterium]
MRESDRLLSDGLAALGLQADGRERELLDAYIAEIELWNNRVDLVGIRRPEDLVVRHILDSLSAVREISEFQTAELADLGSGAGLPGIPLAIVLAGLEFFLVERSGKRAAFLRGAVAMLGIADRVHVIESDVDRLERAYGGVVFRAFRPFTAEVVASISRALVPGGVLAAYKGRRQAIDAELSAIESHFEPPSIVRLQVPFLNEERHLVIARRI